MPTLQMTREDLANKWHQSAKTGCQEAPLYDLQSAYRIIGSDQDDSSCSRGNQLCAIAHGWLETKFWRCVKPYRLYTKHG